MAVTLGIYGATGATGWTTITPSEPSGEGSAFVGAGTRKIYVDSAAANDSGAGTQAAPKKTLAAGIALMRVGKPDHLYLKRGGVWTDESFGSFLVIGVSETEPALISAYGVGARPLIKTMATGNNYVFRQSFTNAPYLAAIGLEFYAYKADPDNPSFDAAFALEVKGFSINGTPTWWLVEDCKTSFYYDNSVSPAVAGNTGTFILRRNAFHNHYSNTSGHSQGWFCSRIDNLLVEENVFDHNGWNGAHGSEPDQFKHNLYLQNDQPGCVVRGNIFARGSSHGLQQRPGGTCYDNLFLNNSIAAFVDSVQSEMSYNTVLQGTDIQSSPVGVRGWGLDVNPGADNTTVHHNIVAHQESSVPGNFAYSIQSGASGVNLHDNIAYDWQAGASTIVDSGTGTTKVNNIIDGVGYPDPTRSVATYNASLGGTASLDAFLTECRLQSKDNWRPAYTAAEVNRYIRQGFGMVNPNFRNRVRLTAAA